MTLSVVIPTKNRPNELSKFIFSLIEQTRKPDQVIIIDQSQDELCSKSKIEKILIDKKINFSYTHNESINGLVQAKNFSLKINNCDIISFFDDDIILKENYLKNIEQVFKNNNHIFGVNGFVLNNHRQSFFKYLFFEITHIGIFRDNRNKAYRNISKELMKLDVLSGGLSSWRTEVFNKVEFDILNNFHGMEDIEFSTRVRKHFPESLYITKKSCLYHYHSSSNRNSEVERVENDIVEGFKIMKKNKNLNYLYFEIIPFILNYFLQSIFLSLKHRSFTFLYRFFRGVILGMTVKVISK